MKGKNITVPTILFTIIIAITIPILSAHSGGHEINETNENHELNGEFTTTTIWVIISVIIVSLISLVGIFFLGFKKNILARFTSILVAIAAGTLLGGALLHLIPHYAEEFGFTLMTGTLVLGGIVLMLFVERVIHWHHCHTPHFCEDPTNPNKKHHKHVQSFGWTILFGDALHNLLDGAIIAASYLVNIEVGIATTIAVILHEIPQEIADFGVLLHAGFSKGKALMVNFLSALTAVLGAIIVLLANHATHALEAYLIPITAGAFIYIGGTDLLPELKENESQKEIIIHLLAFIAGIGLMALLRLME